EAELDPAASLSFDLPVGLPAVRVDSVRMRRIVRRLVRNALDALGPAGGTVVVRTRAVDADDATLAARQPPAERRPVRSATSAQVCDPFFTTKAPGRGLGLAEVLGLVGAQGGGLAVESAPGRGTTVRLLFPALAPSRLRSDEGAPPRAAPRALRRRRR